MNPNPTGFKTGDSEREHTLCTILRSHSSKKLNQGIWGIGFISD